MQLELANYFFDFMNIMIQEVGIYVECENMEHAGFFAELMRFLLMKI